MLKAFFDESGTHNGAAVTAIAGFVGSEESWALLEERWTTTLRNLGISTFHMTDAKAQRGEFSRIERRVIYELQLSLARTIKASSLSAVTAGIDSSAWPDCTTPEFRAKYPKPYDACFKAVLESLRDWATHPWFGKNVQERMEITFAIQHEYTDRSLSAFDAWTRYGGIEVGPIAFDSPRKRPALQAADFLVNELCVSLGDLARNAARTELVASEILSEALGDDIGALTYIPASALRSYSMKGGKYSWID